MWVLGVLGVFFSFKVKIGIIIYYTQNHGWERKIPPPPKKKKKKKKKACRLKTSVAKFAKKPATHRDNVMM